MKNPVTKFDHFTVRSSGGGLNIVPLIDVMFLILAVYVATSLSMTHQKAVPVELAASDSGTKPSGEVKPITLTVKVDGQFYIDDRLLNETEVTESLKAIVQAEPKKVVQLNADKNTRHELVVAALDIVKSVGLKNVTFLVEPKSE